MRWVVELRTNDGGRVSIVLEHWGSGLDNALRRWVLIDGYWECPDTGDFADESHFAGVTFFNPAHPLPGMR
jgi:hypothetical protein